MREFHISRKARDFYRFDAHLFSLNGNVIFADLHTVRTFAQTINEKKDPLFPEKSVSAGDLNAMGLIDEILHFIVALYREQKHPDIMAEGLEWLEKKTGKVHVDQCLTAFMMEFPPLPLYRNEVDAETYFSGQTEGVPNRQILLEEMLMLWLANKNPACSAFDELFDDDELEKHTAYNEIMLSLEDFFDVKSPFGPDNQNLIQMLRSPAVAVPHSLPGQLEYILERWAHLLGKLLFKLMRGLDVIREEKKARFDGTGAAPRPQFYG